MTRGGGRIAVEAGVNRSRVNGQSLELTHTRGAAGRKRVGLGHTRYNVYDFQSESSPSDGSKWLKYQLN